ncbi:methyltransferase [Moorella naiadis]|uniref:methyltransferase family protein n=1 Tax=Moorella naiadis (nom. illeg.) TaxID=3093670 RepID=UPI003D9C87F9
MTKKYILLKQPPVSVEPLYALLNNCSKNYKIFCVLATAVNIRLFEYLGTLKSAKELAEELGTDPELTYNICEVLVVLGLVAKENGSYKNTEVSNLYLKTDSDYFQHEVLKNLQNGFKLWERLGDILKNGSLRVTEQTYFQDNLIHSLASEALVRELWKTIEIIAELPEFRRAERFLDLGGGHGLYSIALTRLNPELKAYIFDFPDIIKDTKTYLQRYAAERVEVIPGNLFKDDLGNEYDFIFFSYNPGGKNPALVPKLYSSLRDGGLFISKHAFYHKGEDSKNPLLDVEWTLSAFKGVEKGSKIYSFAEDLTYEEYLDLLKRYFSIEKIIEANEFGGYPLFKVGDTLDSKIIIAKKKPLE